MGEEKLEFNDDKLFVYTPLPQCGEGVYKTRLVMTKEVFQECYKRWIEPQDRSDKCKNCEYYLNPDYTRCHECKAESEEV